MGLQAQLGVAARRPNLLQRLVQRAGSSRSGAWVFSKILAPLDIAINRLTKGRLNAPQHLGGFPVIILTSIGRRSGKKCISPLVGIPFKGELAVVGSNFGQAAAPAWVFNLASDPSCSVDYFEQNAACVAQELNAEEREDALSEAAKIYAGFNKYRERTEGRHIRVFLIKAE